MGATVLTAIQRTLLGVRVEEPGGAELTVAPPASGINEANGRVPTERGPVTVDWTRSDAEFSMDVTVPWNASARVVLPSDGDADRVTEGEAVVFDAGPIENLPDGIKAVRVIEGGIAIHVTAGTYQFQLLASATNG